MAEERGFPAWEQLYKEKPAEEMPWYHASLDPDLEQALQKLGLSSGAALDIGAGPGTQAIALAERGFRATGTDLSEAAVRGAAERARERGVEVDFRQDDILKSTLNGVFDVVFDRGCFHVLPPEARAEYVRAVAGLVKPGGYLFLKCFSRQQPGETGPYRFTPAEIEEIFGGSFKVRSVEETIYQGTLEQPPRALFSVLER